MKKFSFLILVIAILLPMKGFAWDDKKTHPRITEKAVLNSNLDAYLQNNLGFIKSEDPNQTGTLFKGKYVTELIQKGSVLEDDPACRASNHFHNPLKNWGTSGLTDTWWPVDLWCYGLGLGQYPPDEISSNITWATGFLSQDPNDKDDAVREFNKWDWDSAREYFYTYLTGKDYQGTVVASDENARDEYMTNCFQAVGQVLHLIQDSAVPAHVRNDFSQGHTMVRPVLNEWPWEWIGNAFELHVKRNDSKPWFDSAVGGDLNDPFLTKFWDTDQLDENYSGIDMNTLGLAEYTNLNFLSAYTMFTDEFPFPKAEHCVIVLDTPPNGIPNLDRKYLSSTNGHPGEQINRLAIVSYLDHFRKVYFPNISSEQLPVYLDSACYDEYADKLIPRAIGYSAGLLDYFFRGTIEITNPLIGSNINPNSGLNPADYNHITLFARNTAPDGEDMSLGTFQVVVKYRLSEQDPFQYIVKEEVNNTSSIPSDTAQELEFDLSDNPVPSDAVDLSLYLVYKGKLGQEDDAVGAGFQQPFNHIKISLPDSGTYALTDKDPFITDSSDPRYIANPDNQGFDRIQLLAQNIAPEGEEMTGGTVTLVVKYKVGEGDQFQNPPAATSDEFHYIVKELGGTHSIPRVTPALFEFDISDSQIPLWATDVYISLVYKGNLGGEEGAIAVGFKDISEPTPINYYNVMDKICMTTSTGPQLFDSGSTAAIDYVDVDNNGIADPDEWDVYPHNAANIHIRFSPEDNPQAATSASSADNNYEKAILNPNDYFRLFILSDHRFNRSASVEYVKITAEDQCDQFHGTFPRPPTAMDGIKNQTDLVDPVYCGYEPCNARLTSGFHTTRGVVSFFSVIFDNASYPIDSICSYED